MMRSTMVAGLFVAIALLGAGSARAQGLCSELTFFGDSGTTAGCGYTRSDGTLLVEDLNGTPGIDCPGTNCSGDSYAFADWSDLIRVVLAGMHHDNADNLAMQDCNSDVRWSIVDTWQNLFEGSCTDTTCEQAQHLWRTPDEDAATATVLELLGLPPIDAEPFCNGDELEDNDPIRRSCVDGEDVCQADGTLGLVLPIVPGPGSTDLCQFGVFGWKTLPFSRFECPQGINPLFALCLQPKDAEGHYGCVNFSFNVPFGTPTSVDGRLFNLWALNDDGTTPVVNGKELLAAFDRIHSVNTIAPGASVCLQPTAGARVECLTEASPCSLGMQCKDEPGVFACSEQGILDAIAAGGGPHRFDCAGPTTVTTTSEIIIDNDVILDGEGNLIVDGNDDHRVFRVGSGVTVALQRFVVTGGDATRGGGIQNGGTLTVASSTLSGNTADRGGAIDNLRLATMTVANSTVSGNRANELGGGIHNNSGGTLGVKDSIVSKNVAGTGNDDGGGGGIYARGVLTLTDSRIWMNEARSGGGIYLANDMATLTRITVFENTARFGGGIFNRGMMTLTDSTVSENEAEQGAGIFYSPAIAPVSLVPLILTNSTVSKNIASQSAGGISFSSGKLMLTSSTVSDNTAPFERGAAIGGLSGGGENEILVANSLLTGDCDLPRQPVTSGGYNIESPGNTCGFTGTGDQTTVPPDGPLGLNLGPLQDNGGPTLTQAPESPSAAINRIPLAACAVTTTDQRGEPRPETGGSMCDVGAVEVQQ